ncbi:MAG: hypothetical protein KatS3mg068_1628 [Candidatus Sericytochromatia bacterium]|nr:MAG: hypothetical protein KatS3mg068_1628 [Candidatus Sericytochromatia bacterium]
MIKKTILLSFLFLLLSAFDKSKLNKAIELYNNHNYNEAVILLKELSKDYPDEPDIYLWLSKSYEALFNLNESINANKIYQKLKYLKEKKEQKKIEIKEDINENTKKANFEDIDFDFYSEEIFNYSRLVLITPELISEVMTKRNIDDDKNKKPLDTELVMDLIFSSKNISFDELEIKKHYLINTHQEEIIYKKLQADLILNEINKIYPIFEKEENSEKKTELNLTLKRLADSYNKKVKELIILVNKPVYTNTDPLSFEHYLHLKLDRNLFINSIKEKRNYLSKNLEEVELSIKNYSKELEKKEDEKIQKKINHLSIERYILKEAINKIDETILKVKTLN